jgi:hypothetical protein
MFGSCFALTQSNIDSFTESSIGSVVGFPMEKGMATTDYKIGINKLNQIEVSFSINSLYKSEILVKGKLLDAKKGIYEETREPYYFPIKQNKLITINAKFIEECKKRFGSKCNTYMGSFVVRKAQEIITTEQKNVLAYRTQTTDKKELDSFIEYILGVLK